MHRTSSTPAGRATRQAANTRAQWNSANQSFGPAGPAVSLITGKVQEPPKAAGRPARKKQRSGFAKLIVRSRRIRAALRHEHDLAKRWPILLTIGPHPTKPGCLDVIAIHSRVEADRCGYSWAGHFR